MNLDPAKISAAAPADNTLSPVLVPTEGHAIPLIDDRTGADTRRRLSPVLTNAILRGASAGEPVDIHDLHNIMIRSWLRLGGNIGTVRRAAASAEWHVSPWSDENGEVPEEAKRRHEVVESALFDMKPRPGELEGDFHDYVADSAENCLRGTGVFEMLPHVIEWDERPGTKIVALRAIRKVHPNYYAWAIPGSTDGLVRGNHDRLLFRPGGRRQSSQLSDWPENQFIVQLTPGWNDHPALAGILGLLAVPWIGANHGPQWLFSYAENFGIPFVYANYPAGDVLSRDATYAMLKNYAGRRVGAFPTGATVQMVESTKSASDLPQMTLMEWADKVCDILLLGQTLTTETGGVGSQALGKVHEGVKLDILQAICSQVRRDINRQIIPALMLWNFGDTLYMPCVEHGLKEPENEKAKAETDAIHLANGAAIPKKHYYKRHGIPMPKPDEEVLAPTGGARPAVDPNNPAPQPQPPADPVKAAAAQDALQELLAAETEQLARVFEVTLTAAAKRGTELAGDQIRQAS